MDATDLQLLSMLRENARVSVATLAKKLRVARGTVQNRLKRMEADGTIVGYTVRLHPQAENHQIRALMTVSVDGNRTDEVLKALRGDPAVRPEHRDARALCAAADLRADAAATLETARGSSENGHARLPTLRATYSPS